LEGEEESGRVEWKVPDCHAVAAHRPKKHENKGLVVSCLRPSVGPRKEISMRNFYFISVLFLLMHELTILGEFMGIWKMCLL
jgi:hypothetical protein